MKKLITHTDKTTNKDFPQTIIIRNQFEGMIWQIYHVKNNYDKSVIILNAYNNEFRGISVEDYQPELEETFEGWEINFN